MIRPQLLVKRKSVYFIHQKIFIKKSPNSHINVLIIRYQYLLNEVPMDGVPCSGKQVAVTKSVSVTSGDQLLAPVMNANPLIPLNECQREFVGSSVSDKRITARIIVAEIIRNISYSLVYFRHRIGNIVVNG